MCDFVFMFQCFVHTNTNQTKLYREKRVAQNVLPDFLKDKYNGWNI